VGGPIHPKKSANSLVFTFTIGVQEVDGIYQFQPVPD